MDLGEQTFRVAICDCGDALDCKNDGVRRHVVRGDWQASTHAARNLVCARHPRVASSTGDVNVARVQTFTCPETDCAIRNTKGQRVCYFD